MVKIPWIPLLSAFASATTWASFLPPLLSSFGFEHCEAFWKQCKEDESTKWPTSNWLGSYGWSMCWYHVGVCLHWRTRSWHQFIIDETTKTTIHSWISNSGFGFLKKPKNHVEPKPILSLYSSRNLKHLAGGWTIGGVSSSKMTVISSNLGNPTYYDSPRSRGLSGSLRQRAGEDDFKNAPNASESHCTASWTLLSCYQKPWYH